MKNKGVYEIKRFIAKRFNESEIVLNSAEQLDELFETIEAEENFIIKWTEDKTIKAEIVIASNLAGRVKNGEIKLKSEKVKEV